MNQQENTIAFLGIWRGQITIPASGASGESLLALLRAGGYHGPSDPLQVSISGSTLALAARAGFIAANTRPGAALDATDFTTHGYPCASGAEYLVPSALDASTTYLRSAAGAFVAQAQVLW